MRVSTDQQNRKVASRSQQSAPVWSAYDVALPVGRSVYVPGSQGMWWKPLQAPDFSPKRHAGNGVEGKEILIVEDETYLCDLIADVLQAEGHSTRSASNGREALERMHDFTPDLILLDLMMPVMDGWELMTVMRADPRLSEVPVVIITAIYDLKNTQQQTGARAVLTKPFDIDQLAEVVRAYA